METLSKGKIQTYLCESQINYRFVDLKRDRIPNSYIKLRVHKRFLTRGSTAQNFSYGQIFGITQWSTWTWYTTLKSHLLSYGNTITA